MSISPETGRLFHMLPAMTKAFGLAHVHRSSIPMVRSMNKNMDRINVNIKLNDYKCPSNESFELQSSVYLHFKSHLNNVYAKQEQENSYKSLTSPKFCKISSTTLRALLSSGAAIFTVLLEKIHQKNRVNISLVKWN